MAASIRSISVFRSAGSTRSSHGRTHGEVLRAVILLALLVGGLLPLPGLPARTAVAQNYQRTFGAPTTGSDERAAWIETTPDGGSILVGSTSQGAWDIWLMKTDAAGIPQWEKRIGNPGALELGHGVINTSDGGFLVLAHSSQFGQSSLRLVIKTDGAGTVQWIRIIQGMTPGNAGGPALAELLDHDGSSMGYAIGGEIPGSLIGIPSLWKAPLLSRLSTTGTLLWTRYYIDNRYGLSTNGTFTDVHGLPGGDIVATGYTADGLGARDTLLMKVDAAGALLWAKTYSSGLHNDWAHGMDRAPNGDWVIVGYNKEIGEGGGSFLLRTDPAGTLLWYRTFQFFSPSPGIRCTPADEIVLLGYRAPMGTEVALLKTDGTGAFQWAMAYGGGSSELAGGVALRPSGGYTLFCATSSFGVDPFDWWLIGTDAAGVSTCNEFRYPPLLPVIVPVVEDVDFRSTILAKMYVVAVAESPLDPDVQVLCDDGTSGACCYFEQGLCLCIITTQEHCERVLAGVYQGDGSACTPDLCCPPQIGACCWLNAANMWQCDVTSQERCEGILLGTYLGDGSACTPNPCDPPRYGACCSFQQGSWHCTITTADHCEQVLAGVYQGDSTTCTPDPCPQEFGACCFLAPDGTMACMVTTQLECEVSLGGLWHGAGTVCTPDPCERGACCYRIPGTPGWYCVVTTEADCLASYTSGVFQGPGTSCVPNPCPPPATGGCCLQTPVGFQCLVMTAADCRSSGGVYLGDNVSCVPDPCAQGACCTPFAGCIQVSAADCAEMGGVYLGDFIPCLPNPCLVEAPCVTPPTGMVLWTPFDAATGSVAHEIAAGNHGTRVNAPAVIAGAVGNALSFNGVNQYVTVPHAPHLNPGVGDLTVDAWIRTTASSGVRPIVDKRSGLIGSTIGYTMFLYNGQLSFQLADNLASPGHTNYLSGVGVANGQWRHVAVTVQRGSPTGGRFYVDGVHVATFNPTGRPGSLNTPAAVWIGRRHPINSVLHWAGDIDEVEIFRRALSATEIQAIHAAGPNGKCKVGCHVPWDHPFCKNQTSVTVPITVCNHGAAAAPFHLSFAGLPGCDIPGPTVFTVVGPDPVMVPPYACVTVNVVIQRPAGMNAVYQVACYEVTIQNQATGQSITCHGSVQDRRDLCSVIVWPPVEVISVPVDIAQPIVFEVTNTTDAPITAPLRIVAYDPDMQPSMDVSLNGLPPGEPWGRVVVIPPSLSAPVEIQVSAMFVAHEGIRFSDIVVYTDIEADGTWEPLHSVGLRSMAAAPCPADLDGSGSVDLGDLLVLLSFWGTCPAGAACPADLDHTDAVDLADLLVLLANWGPCP